MLRALQAYGSLYDDQCNMINDCKERGHVWFRLQLTEYKGIARQTAPIPDRDASVNLSTHMDDMLTSAFFVKRFSDTNNFG